MSFGTMAQKFSQKRAQARLITQIIRKSGSDTAQVLS